MASLPTVDIQDYLTKRLPAVLPPDASALLARAAGLAEDEGWGLYLVGGYVRDSLLGVPDYDIDLAVEGLAPELARRLAAQTGARMEVYGGFGTAVLAFEGHTFHLDLVTARRETYERPGALPTVTPGTIEDDLARRDFTVNAMAVGIARRGFGPLLDPHLGLADLRAGLIRVLHPDSFRDDPTRIFRAVKLAARLGWRLEDGTLELAFRAVRDGALGTVSIERITRELLLIMQEPRGEKMMYDLHRLGVLAQVHPLLAWRYPQGRNLIAPGANASPAQRQSALLAAIGSELAGDQGEAENLARWLHLEAPQVRLVSASAELAATLPALAEADQKPSRTYRLLSGIAPEAIQAFLLLEPVLSNETVTARLRDYFETLRFVRPELSGDYLKAQGIRPGPIYGKVLDALQDARLDGVVTTLADEEAFVRRMLALEGEHPSGR